MGLLIIISEVPPRFHGPRLISAKLLPDFRGLLVIISEVPPRFQGHPYDY